MYARRTGSRTLTFIVSGMLWRNSLIMRDLETGSDWSHITGECVRGSLEGTTLEALPSVQTTWAEWRRAYPDTRLLVKSAEVRSSHYAEYFADPDRNGLFRTEWLREQLPGKALVHGLARGPFALAVTDSALARDGVVVHDLAGEQVELRRSPDGGVRGYVVTDPDGDAPPGGTREEVTVGRFFWFAWSSFYPNTRLVR